MYCSSEYRIYWTLKKLPWVKIKEVTCFLSELKDNFAVCGCCHTKTKIHRDVQKQYCLFIFVAALWCSYFGHVFGPYFIVLCFHMCVGWNSVVSIVNHYGLDGQGIEFWGGGFSAPVQTSPGACPASCTTGTGSFLGIKWPGHGADHPPPSKRQGQERVGLYLYSPSEPQCPVTWRTFHMCMLSFYKSLGLVTVLIPCFAYPLHSETFYCGLGKVCCRGCIKFSWNKHSFFVGLSFHWFYDDIIE